MESLNWFLVAESDDLNLVLVVSLSYPIETVVSLPLMLPESCVRSKGLESYTAISLNLAIKFDFSALAVAGAISRKTALTQAKQ